jgi:hypothetical protein
MLFSKKNYAESVSWYNNPSIKRHPDNRTLLEMAVPEVIMPKGKYNRKEIEREYLFTFIKTTSKKYFLIDTITALPEDSSLYDNYA